MTLANAFNLYRTALSLTLLLIFAATLNAQQAVSIGQPREQAFSLLDKGDSAGATKLLRTEVKANKNNTDAWHALGLAMKANGKKGDARKAFSRAYKLRLEAAFNQLATPLNEDTVDASALVAQNPSIGAILDKAAESLAQLMTVDSKAARKQQDELNTMQALAIGYREGASATKIYATRDVDKRAVILRAPEAPYTKEARERGITGVVKLRVVLAPDGTVRFPRVLKSLPYGLTEQAIRYALRLKFEPAIKDGRTVPVFTVLAFTFNLY